MAIEVGDKIPSVAFKATGSDGLVDITTDAILEQL